MAINTSIRDYNSVNLMTEQPTADNKAYVVDKRLVDHLLKQFTNGDLTDIKDQLTTIIAHADDKDSMFQKLDDYIYLNGIVNMLPKEDTSCVPVTESINLHKEH